MIRFNYSKLLIALLLVTTIVVHITCSTTQHLDSKVLAIHKPDFLVHYTVQHSADTSRLLLQVPSMKFNVQLNAYTNFKARELIYQRTTTVEWQQDNIGAFVLPVSLPIYALEIKIIEAETGRKFHDIITIDKLKTNQQTINLFTIDNKPILNQTNLKLNQSIRIKHNKSTIDTFFVKYYPTFRPAPPPFSKNNRAFNAQYGFTESFTIKRNEAFTLDRLGTYYIQTNKNSQDGVVVRCFDNDYPKLTNADELILSTRYITKNSEYKELSKAKYKKKALDNFWLERNSNKNRAKELIKRYYNRVQEANLLFPSYKAGWKTDRGITYSIFGKPSKITKGPDYEYWYYRPQEGRGTVAFFFDKKGPQYRLRRSPYYETEWNAAIYQIRGGVVR